MTKSPMRIRSYLVSWEILSYFVAFSELHKVQVKVFYEEIYKKFLLQNYWGNTSNFCGLVRKPEL